MKDKIITILVNIVFYAVVLLGVLYLGGSIYRKWTKPKPIAAPTDTSYSGNWEMLDPQYREKQRKTAIDAEYYRLKDSIEYAKKQREIEQMKNNSNNNSYNPLLP